LGLIRHAAIPISLSIAAEACSMFVDEQAGRGGAEGSDRGTRIPSAHADRGRGGGHRGRAARG